MPKCGGSVHVATIKTKGAGDHVYVSYLLRRSYREGGRVRHENLGNLSHLPEAAISAIRRVLAGETLVSAEDRFGIERSLPHGQVAAVLGAVRSLDLERLISREPSRERDLAVALICQRLLSPGSKLSTTRRFSQTTLSEDLCARRSWGGGAPRGHGLAACPPGADRAGAGPPSPCPRGLRALRSLLQLLRGRRAGQAPDHLRPHLLPRGSAGGSGGLPGQHPRPADAARRGRLGD